MTSAGNIDPCLDAINSMDSEQLTKMLSVVIDDPSWLIEEIAKHRPFSSLDDVGRTVQRVAVSLSKEQISGLLNSSPEMASLLLRRIDEPPKKSN